MRSQKHSIVTITLIALCCIAVLPGNGIAKDADSVLDYSLKDIDGKDVPLSKYKGKVILIVNVASKCGLTPQYEDIEMLYEKYSDKGLVVLGFPANNFGKQEPGTNTEIKQFCTLNYGVKFPMFSKISVKDDDIHELYTFLTSQKTSPFPGEIKWNFTKFIVGRDGKLIQRFEPKIKPSSPDVIDSIEKALAVK